LETVTVSASSKGTEPVDSLYFIDVEEDNKEDEEEDDDPCKIFFFKELKNLPDEEEPELPEPESDSARK